MHPLDGFAAARTFRAHPRSANDAPRINRLPTFLSSPASMPGKGGGEGVATDPRERRRGPPPSGFTKERGGRAAGVIIKPLRDRILSRIDIDFQ